jgi:tRNA-dihydrouridine synthase 1
MIYHEDLEKCLETTKCDGVMLAEGNLYNPAIFTDKIYPAYKLAEEYLQICKEYPNSANISMIRAHMFKLFHASLSDHTDIREKFVKNRTAEQMEEDVQELKRRFLEAGATEEFTGDVIADEDGIKPYPKWALQPYIRKPMPDQAAEESKENSIPSEESANPELKREAEETLVRKTSKKRKSYVWNTMAKAHMTM